MAYEGYRAMFEAYARNKYASTGVIQWMLNNAWPGMIGRLYDWYLRPGGAYFGAKKANEPLHAQYSHDDHSVAVANSDYRTFPGIKVTARVYNSDMTEKFSPEATATIGEDSTTSETLDGDKSTWYHTPTKTFADFTALNRLPPPNVQVSTETRQPGTGGSAPAFGVHPKVTKGGGGDEILPVLWEDNYFPLLPGETRRVSAAYAARDLGGATPIVEAAAWNTKPTRAQ